LHEISLLRLHHLSQLFSVELASDRQVTEFPRRLDLSKGKVFLRYIAILDKQDFDIYKHKSDHRQELQKSPQNPWANLGVWTKAPIAFGECHGEKSVYVQPGKNELEKALISCLKFRVAL